MADQGSVELTAVVAALAGVPRGDTFAVLGSAPLLVAALSAAAGHGPALGPVDVAVALGRTTCPPPSCCWAAEVAWSRSRQTVRRRSGRRTGTD